ncbi:MAG: hypothetical protein M3Y85_08725 [Bacteroidota bacterium]|nr:hypothetical protein [Bacteroidota bacterium]
MTYKLILLPLAEIEIWEAAEYYEKEKEGLGLEFLNALDEAKQNLCETLTSIRIFRLIKSIAVFYCVVFLIK